MVRCRNGYGQNATGLAVNFGKSCTVELVELRKSKSKIAC